MTTTYPPLRLKITPRNSLKLKVQSGASGPPGAQGAAGIGIPPGGTLGQVLAKVSGVDFATQWITPGTLSDGDKGDIVVSGSGSVWTIDNKSALTKADDTNVTLTLGGTPATALLQAVSLTLGWTGQLAVARGGTGAATLSNHGIVLGQGTSPVAVTAALSDGQLLVGQTGADPLPKTISGDLTVSAAGAMTIASGAVTNAKLANMASGTYKMRVSGGSGAPEDATAAQATAGLNVMVGDSGSGGLKGLVPAPIAGDATKFLRGDGNFATPAGSGGNVNGPGSSTDNAVARFDGVAGTLIQNSGVIVDDSNNVSGIGTLASGPHTITATSTNALAVGRLGATTPAFQIDSNTASSITGVKVTAAATGGGVSVAAVGETNVALKLDGAGSGAVRLGTISSGGIECGNPVNPATNDGAALGTTSLKWSDLFLASGAVVNFNAGDVTITHSADALSFAGGSYAFDNYLDLVEIASPSNPAADHLKLFAKDVAGSTHLFTRDNAGTEKDLSVAAGSGATVVATQVFTSSGTYTPRAGLLYCIIENLGGGAGGGGVAGNSSFDLGGGGGGAGGYSRAVISAATIGASKTVTIGAAGNGGASGANNGSNGGDTIVGGQTVTITIASPAVVSWTGHGLVAGQSLSFSTSGALPTGITAGTQYFVIAAGLGANSFEISATKGGAAINTSGSQSGTHTANICVAKGGTGGLAGTSASLGFGGAGGVAGVGDLTATGASGGTSFYWSLGSIQGSSPPAGFGASSPFGGGGVQNAGIDATSAVAGNAAAGFGAGGGGASANRHTSNAAGGNGSAGLVIITEFATA